MRIQEKVFKKYLYFFVPPPLHPGYSSFCDLAHDLLFLHFLAHQKAIGTVSQKSCKMRGEIVLEDPKVTNTYFSYYLS